MAVFVAVAVAVSVAAAPSAGALPDTPVCKRGVVVVGGDQSRGSC